MLMNCQGQLSFPRSIWRKPQRHVFKKTTWIPFLILLLSLSFSGSSAPNFLSMCIRTLARDWLIWWADWMCLQTKDGAEYCLFHLLLFVLFWLFLFVLFCGSNLNSNMKVLVLCYQDQV